MRAIAVVLLLAAACGDNRRGPSTLTPEQAVANGRDGATLVVEGLVHTLTFENDSSDQDAYVPGEDRFLLMRTVRPPGVTMEDLDSGNLQAAWGLGVRIPAAQLASAPIPQIGDRVRATGTFRRVPWSGSQVPVLEGATIEILETSTTLAGAGEACTNDLDCHDRLICARASRTCAAPPEITWGSDWRNLHGTCLVDDDCPLGQVCDPAYTTAMEGEFAPPYFIDRDAGKHLCVLAPGATLEQVCPRVLTTADLSGGRFVPGKEVCVRGETWLAVHAEDGDTHLQLVTEEPLPYPTADSPYWLFGSTTENPPPYKDPSRPQGALVDPLIGDVVVAVGTMRFDDTHGWWEMHPAKAYFPVTKGRGLADAQRRYRTHPGALDELDYEKLERSWGKDEKERARELERERAPR